MFNDMECCPCYIPPERMRQLAITELKALDSLPDDIWIESSSIRLGPEGTFTHREVHKSSKMGRFIRASYAMQSWRDSMKGLDVRRVHARRQVFVALLGYASMWLAGTEVVEETRQEVALEDRVVLDPCALVKGLQFDLGTVSSSDGAEKFLRSLGSVPLTVADWTDHIECKIFRKSWHMVHEDDENRSNGVAALLYSCTCSLRRSRWHICNSRA